jgi:Spy/CpxP family protein refolding chaperone
MRKTIALLGLLLLPAGLLAQGRSQRREGPGRPQANVIEQVLQHKADLALTAEQVTRLETLSNQLSEKQKPILEEMRKQREGGVRPRDLTDEQRAEARKTMEKLRAHREEALNGVKDVLTDEQEQKVKSLLEDGRPRRRGGKR